RWSPSRAASPRSNIGVDQGRRAEQFGRASGVSSLINARRLLADTAAGGGGGVDGGGLLAVESQELGVRLGCRLHEALGDLGERGRWGRDADQAAHVDGVVDR